MAPVTASKISTVTVGSGGASSIDFNNIPQIYTDLKLVLSLRSTISTYTNDDFQININGLSTNQASRYLQANGTSATGSTVARWGGLVPADGSTTASIFGHAEIYIPNYTSSSYKVSLTESVNENNANESYFIFKGQLWSSNDAINRLTIVCADGLFKQYSTATLYGIKSVAAGAKALGGEISQVGNYYIHTFNSTGTFTPLQNLTIDYLVVAGGGGGGFGYNGYGVGGGGAGGVRSSVGTTGGGGVVESGFNVTPQSYTITVGAGGSNGTAYYPSTPYEATNGSNSSIASTVVSIGGGKGGWYGSNGANGGSGGGGGAASTASGGSGTTGQGYAGGGVVSGAGYYGGGGGGGAGSIGSGNTLTGTGQPGGSGISNSISGASTTYGAGGRGGFSNTTGNTPPTAASNTGNGGGGGTGGNAGGSGAGAGTAGGSGVVIIRYSV